MTFTIPEGVTSIRLGVLWGHTGGVAVGDAFYLNEVALFKHEDDDYFAGFEESERAAEADAFENYHPIRINGAFPEGATSGGSSYVLTGSNQVANAIIGPVKNLKVYPGDVIRAEAYARFSEGRGEGTGIAGALVGALQAAFGLASGGSTDAPFQAVDNLFGAGPLIGTAAFPFEDEYAPAAYINYILFDESFVPYDFGYDQISADAVMPNPADRLSIVAKVTKPGYIYIYLSNESEVVQEVYFDDFAIKHVRGVAEQENDYYPFGLTFNSYKRENSVENRIKFQGQEHIDDLDLGWDSFKWRNHQPDIGRFFNIDPLAEKYLYNSPYAFSENKVVAHIELEGLEAVPIALPRPLILPRVGPIPLPPGEIVLPPTTTMNVPPDANVGQPSAEATNKTGNVDWNNPPSSPDELGEGWEETTDSRNESGSRDFRHNESKEEVRWDPGKEGKPGWEGKNHWHRNNPERTGKKDYYLDKNGNPVPRGSGPSHIEAPSLNFFQKSWKDLKEWYKKDLERRREESNPSPFNKIV